MTVSRIVEPSWSGHGGLSGSPCSRLSSRTAWVRVRFAARRRYLSYSSLMVCWTRRGAELHEDGDRVGAIPFLRGLLLCGLRAGGGELRFELVLLDLEVLDLLQAGLQLGLKLSTRS